jgi:2-oxoglutarate ferredoxin oxidoreductase subunit gamma
MKILFAGEGGQGVQLAAEILAHAAFLEGKGASLIPNFGVEQRGGVSLAFIIIDRDVSYPKFEKADILAVFCDRAIKRVQRYIDRSTIIFSGPAVTSKVSENQEFRVEDKDLPVKVWNILVLGKIVKQTKIVNKKQIITALEEKLAEKFNKDPSLKELNLKAIL